MTSLYYKKIHPQRVIVLSLSKEKTMNYSFSIEEAQQYGVDEAILLQNFLFWIRKNAANNRHQYDGRTWTYNSKKALTKLFPFWSYDQVKRALNSLIKQGVLVTGNYNKIRFDRTLWYAFKDEQLFLGDFTKEPESHENQPLDEMHHSQKVSISTPLGEITQPIPDKKHTNKKPEKNHNNTPEIIAELSPVVVVELEKTFSKAELPAAKKITASVPVQLQLEVLAVLVAALKTKVVKNKIAYLRGIINKVEDGTFTALPAQIPQETAADRIKKENLKQREAENRGKIDNVSYFVNLYKTLGNKLSIPVEYLQAVQEQLANQGIAYNFG